MPHQYDFNSRFETDGIFWSTSDPAKTFAAHLTVDEKRIKLLPAAELVGPEKLFPQLNEEAVSGVIHGYTTVGQCTLVGLQDIGSPSHLNGITGQIIRARQLRAGLCIVGFHLACSSAQVLSCATCGYAGLENWLPANSKMAFTDEEVSITYRRNPSPLVDLCVLASKLRITLKAGSDVRYGLDGHHSASNQPRITFEPTIPTSLDFLFDVAYRFENFLSLLLGTSVRLQTVHVETGDGKDGWLVRHERSKAEQTDVQAWTKCDASQLGAAIAAWLTTPEEFRPVENLIYGTIRDSSMFVETEFLSLAQAVEAFHRFTNHDALVESSIFETICKSLHKAITTLCHNSHLAARLSDAIRFANEPSFKNRVESLMGRLHPDHVQSLLGDGAEFEQTLRQTRNFFTHPGSKKQRKVITDPKSVFLFNQKLHSFLRLLMLLNLGFPEDLVFEPAKYLAKKWT